MSSPIEVLAIRKLDGKSSVKAFRRCQGRRPRLEGWQDRLPGRPAQQVVEIASKDLRERITDAVLAAWAKHQERVPLPERGRRAWQ